MLTTCKSFKSPLLTIHASNETLIVVFKKINKKCMVKTVNQCAYLFRHTNLQHIHRKITPNWHKINFEINRTPYIVDKYNKNL